MVRDDVMGNAADPEDEALVSNAKRHEGRKREIRKSTLRRRKTPTQESTSQGFSLPAAAPQVLWLLETGQAGIWEPDVDICNPSPQISLTARIWANKTLPGAGESSSGARAVNHCQNRAGWFLYCQLLQFILTYRRRFPPNSGHALGHSRCDHSWARAQQPRAKGGEQRQIKCIYPPSLHPLELSAFPKQASRNNSAQSCLLLTHILTNLPKILTPGRNPSGGR